MKTFKSIFLFVLSFVLIVSCEKISVENYSAEPTEDYIEIGFSAKLPPEVYVSSTTKAGSSSDLYGVEVYEATCWTDSETDLDRKHNSHKYYACGLFDDLNTEKIKLYKNRTYFVKIVYIPNGKNIIQSVGDGYAAPFYPRLGDGPAPVLGKYTYGSCTMDSSMGAVCEKGSGASVYGNQGSTVEIYQGGTIIEANPENSMFSVELYKMMYNLVVEVENLKEGRVLVTMGNTYQNTISNNGYVHVATPDNPVIDKMLQMPVMPGSSHLRDENGNRLYQWTPDYYKKWHLFAVCDFLFFYYEKPSGEIIELFDIILQEFYPRMCKLYIPFDVEGYIDDYTGSISADVMTDNSTSVTITEQR